MIVSVLCLFICCCGNQGVLAACMMRCVAWCCVILRCHACMMCDVYCPAWMLRGCCVDAAWMLRGAACGDILHEPSQRIFKRKETRGQVEGGEGMLLVGCLV